MTVGRKWLLSVSLALVLAGTAACGGDDSTGADAGKEPAAPAAAGPPQPDLQGIPAVVASVNGEKIARAEFVQAYQGQFAQAAQQAQSAGQPLDQTQLKKQLLDAIIGAKLLSQEAQRRDYTASDAAVDKELGKAAKENGFRSVEEFLAAVEGQGTKRAVVRSEFRTQVMVNQLLAEEAGNVKPTDKEIEQLYARVAAQARQPGGPGGPNAQLPTLEQLRPRLQQQLRSEKESAVAKKLVRTYREGAKVTVNI